MRHYLCGFGGLISWCGQAGVVLLPTAVALASIGVCIILKMIMTRMCFLMISASLSLPIRFLLVRWLLLPEILWT